MIVDSEQLELLSRALTRAITAAAGRPRHLSDDKLREISQIVGLALIEKLHSGETDPAILQQFALDVVKTHLPGSLDH